MLKEYVICSQISLINVKLVLVNYQISCVIELTCKLSDWLCNWANLKQELTCMPIGTKFQLIW